MISESKFYDMCDKGAELDIDITGGYYPTVEELKEKGVDKNPEKYLPILTYFAENPFTRMHIPGYNDREYKKMIGFVNEILGNVELKEDSSYKPDKDLKSLFNK